MPWHFQQDRPFREARLEVVRSYAGKTTYPGYLGSLPKLGPAAMKEILNLTLQAAEAFTLNMAANRPRFMVTSRYVQYDSFAGRMERALNRYAEELYLEEILQDIARDSFFSLGVGKVYQASSIAVGIQADYRMDPGRPFLQRVSTDRFVRDTSANYAEEATFFGDLYQIPYHVAIESRRFSREVRAKLRKIGASRFQHQEENTESVGATEQGEPIEDSMYLCDVYLPQRKSVWTFVCDKQFGFVINEPVQRVKWKGAECGPYHFLNMGPIPDHFMPSSPGQNGRLLVDFSNTLYRKLEDQAMQQKTIPTAGTTKDAEMARDLHDGEWGIFEEPDKIKGIRLGGPDQSIFGLFLNCLQQHSRSNGNLEQKLGQGAQADTARQEEMIAAGVNRLDAFFQGRYVSFVRKCAQSLAMLLYDDQTTEVPGKWTIPGSKVEVDDSWLPGAADGARVGPYDFYRVDIDPRSMGYRTPSQRLAAIDARVTSMMTFAPFLAESGERIDIQEYMAAVADLESEPLYRKIFKSNQPPMDQQPGAAHNRTLGAGGPGGDYMHHSDGGAGASPEAEQMSMFQSSQPEAAA